MASLASLLAGVPDPEAQGAMNSSNAMAPVIAPYLADVLSGRAAAQSLPQSTYDPNRSFAQNALDPRGIENAMNMTLGFSGGGLGIKAYHGSPYDFNAFDASKIGTGEGAQAYGHGLYFAEQPQVAEGYRFAGQSPWAGAGPAGIVQKAQTVANAKGLSGDEAKRFALDWLNTQANALPTSARQPVYDALNNFDTLMRDKPGKMYEVNINAEPHQFLDWDKPLAAQSEQIKRALADNRFAHPTAAIAQPGGAIYDRAASNAALMQGRAGFDYPGASQAFSQAGIPGIRYLDQGSRGAGQGTSNYVVFDPSIVDILKKYGLAGLLASGGAVLGQEDK